MTRKARHAPQRKAPRKVKFRLSVVLFLLGCFQLGQILNVCLVPYGGDAFEAATVLLVGAVSAVWLAHRLYKVGI